MFQLEPWVRMMFRAIAHVHEAVLILYQVQVKQYGLCHIQEQCLFLCYFRQVCIKISQHRQPLHLGVDIVLLEYDFTM